MNGCLEQAQMALKYLASYPRPTGGQEAFNAEHLLQIAEELSALKKMLRTISDNA